MIHRRFARRHSLARWSVGIATLLALQPLATSAHTGQPPRPHDIWTSWSFDPFVIVGIVFACWTYWRGAARLRRRGGPHAFPLQRAAAYFGGMLTLAVALISPLDALGSALFSAHMVQHLLLMIVASPLIVIGEPFIPFLWALPDNRRHQVAHLRRRARIAGNLWDMMNRPLIAWLLASVILWIWHLPVLYQAALRSELVHAFEHGCFLGTSLLFWWVLLRTHGRRTLAPGTGVLYVFAMGMQSGVLGALMTFSATPWYPIHAGRVSPWGLTLLEDQQLAGLIMWIPASAVYLLAAAMLFVTWLQHMDALDDGVRSVDIWAREVATHAAPQQDH